METFLLLLIIHTIKFHLRIQYFRRKLSVCCLHDRSNMNPYTISNISFGYHYIQKEYQEDVHTQIFIPS
jgi:hypothetical protein